MMRSVLPLLLFIVLVVFLSIGLTKDPRELPSALIGKPSPGFNLPQLYQPQQRFNAQSLQGKVWILNVWASWCVSCRAEHEMLKQMVARHSVMLIGLNYKDQPQDAQQYLRQHGDPYQQILSDVDGRVGIDWGVSAVPETFVVDKHGIVRYKHTGPVTYQSLQEIFFPLLKQLESQS